MPLDRAEQLLAGVTDAYWRAFDLLTILTDARYSNQAVDYDMIRAARNNADQLLLVIERDLKTTEPRPASAVTGSHRTQEGGCLPREAAKLALPPR